MCFRLRVADPRDPTDIAALDVEYDYTPGASPIRDDIYGGDPGYPPEIEIHLALNKRDRCVLWALTAAQQADLIQDIQARHDHG